MLRSFLRPVRLLPTLLASAALLASPTAPTDARSIAPACLEAPSSPTVARSPGPAAAAAPRTSAVPRVASGSASLITDVGAPGAWAEGVARVGDLVLFTTDDGVHGREPWVTDGTEAGTHLLRDVWAGPISSRPGRLTASGGQVFFTARTSHAGFELWVTDGTTAGTHLVRDLRTGASGSSPAGLTPFGGGVAFVANDGRHGREPWVSDGTTAGTHLLRDLVPGRDPSRVGPMARVGDRLYLGAAGQLWVSDGSRAGTRAVLPPRVPYRGVTEIVAWRGRAWFLQDVGSGGCAAYDVVSLGVSDGSLTGTRIVAVVDRGSGDVFSLRALPDRLVFAAPSDRGLRLWSSDGTAAGTRVIRPKGYDGALESDGWPDMLLTQVAGRAWFATKSGTQTWTTDGRSYGEIQVAGIGRSDETVALGADAIVPWLGRVWFTKAISTEIAPDDWQTDVQLWSTDLAIHDLRLEADLGRGIGGMAAMDGWLFLLIDDGVHGLEPWRFDP